MMPGEAASIDDSSIAEPRRCIEQAADISTKAFQVNRQIESAGLPDHARDQPYPTNRFATSSAGFISRFSGLSWSAVSGIDRRQQSGPVKPMMIHEAS
jgi:hypothetical protein